LHEVIGKRYENRSTIITSNLNFTEWGEAFSNTLLGERPSTACAMAPAASSSKVKVSDYPGCFKKQIICHLQKLLKNAKSNISETSLNGTSSGAIRPDFGGFFRVTINNS
jgi:hypothetical protein